MTFTIKTIEDLIALWPIESQVKYLGSEIQTSCPFCTPNDLSIWKNGVSFTGEDRFVITKTGAFCRHCHRNGTAPRHITFTLLAQKFNGELANEFKTEVLESAPVYNRPENFTETTISEAHSSVFKPFWQKFGWSNETINIFKLGLYEMYGNVSHIIPYKAIDTENDEVSGWVMEGRVPDDEGKTNTVRSRGLYQRYVFFLNEDPSNKQVVITEGVKDGITAYQLGYRNILAISGSTIWTKEKSLFLSRHGFTSALVVGDNDQAGKAFNQEVVSRNTAVGISTSILNWTEEKPLKYDLTNLLQDLGIKDGQDYIQNNQAVSRPDRPLFTSLIPRPVEGNGTDDYIDIEEIRGDGGRSIKYNLECFISDYAKRSTRGHGALLLLNASPGTGKTHTLVRAIEPLAAKRRQSVDEDKDSLLSEIARLQQEISEKNNPEDSQEETKVVQALTRHLDDISYASVLWFSKFRKSTKDLMELSQNPNLWFDYEGRNLDNCENFAITQELGQKNHDIRSFCETACPFRDACKRNGYLSQEEKMKDKSITIVRHQNLINKGLIDKHKDLIVVDESPLDVIESPMEIERRTLSPVTPTWYMQLNADPEFPAIKSAVLFVQSIKHCMDTVGEKEELSGTELFVRMDRDIQSSSDGTYTLESVMSNLDQAIFEDYYQPTYLVSGVSEIYYRTVPFVYRALSKEYIWYKNNPNHETTDVSQVTISRVRSSEIPILTLFQMKTPQIKPSVPVVVADATTREPELYQIGFDRRVEVYAPESRNENLKEYVLYGRDFTTGFRQRRFGALLRDKKHMKQRVAENLSGDKFDLNSVQMTGDVYEDNKAAMDYFDMITYVASRNDSCLVVTHKDVQELLEEPFRVKYPLLQERIKWGHFGALRGDNQYRDIMSAVIFGVPRIPYDVITKRSRAWSAIKGDMTKIGSEMIYKAEPYGNHELGNEHITFVNPLAARLVDIQEKGEIQQATERIRPHVTKEPKQIYYCMTRPMDAKNIIEVRHFDEVMNEWRSERKVEDGADYIVQSIKRTGKKPPINEVRRVCHIQYEDAKKAFTLVMERNLELFTGAG